LVIHDHHIYYYYYYYYYYVFIISILVVYYIYSIYPWLLIIDPEKFGTFFEVSIESNDLKNFKSNFFESGIPIMKNMVDRISGRNIRTAFVGVCYYIALQHQVEEKMFYRITGNVNSISKQPTEGKSHNGGLRIGEMEKDALVTHGANTILQDMFRNNTNSIEIKYYDKCHS